MIRIKKIITLLIISSSIVLGANTSTVNSGTIERQIQTPKVPFEKKENIEIQGLQNDSVKSDISNKKIFVKDFAFSGNKLISSEELKDSIKAYIGKELTFNQIQELLAIVTKIYIDKGYFVARA